MQKYEFPVGDELDKILKFDFERSKDCTWTSYLAQLLDSHERVISIRMERKSPKPSAKLSSTLFGGAIRRSPIQNNDVHRTTTSAARVQRILFLEGQGLQASEIARSVGCAPTTIRRILREHEKSVHVKIPERANHERKGPNPSYLFPESGARRKANV